MISMIGEVIVPRDTSRKTRRRDGACKCGGPRDRPGQAFCRLCHAVYMKDYRKKQKNELESLWALAAKRRQA
jgi:hypothetical protein